MLDPRDAALARRRALLVAGSAALLGASGLARANALAATPAPMPFTAADTGPVLVQPLSRRDALDWKQVLLAGDRYVKLRRDGPAVDLRYRRADGSLDLDGYVAACHLLRDVRANQTVQIDPHLLDVLCGIQRWMDFNGQVSTIEITSGYRTVKTNESAEGSGRHSMHLYGKAADIMVPGASGKLIGQMVQRFNNEGGTGIYLGRDFVHVDTGEARTWVTGLLQRASAKRRARKRR